MVNSSPRAYYEMRPSQPLPPLPRYRNSSLPNVTTGSPYLMVLDMDSVDADMTSPGVRVLIEQSIWILTGFRLEQPFGWTEPAADTNWGWGIIVETNRLIPSAGVLACRGTVTLTKARRYSVIVRYPGVCRR
jgi:hypothetical protein